MMTSLDQDPADRERALDEALQETFPASDPPAITVEIAERGGAQSVPSVSNNHELQRFEIPIDGETAFLSYERRPRELVLVHTEVPEALRGRHLAETLVETALDAARREGLQVVAVCPFVRAYLRKHPH
jgi:predicted GNAT family acetyltransferase